MSRSLIDRYSFGHSGFIAPFSAEAEIVFETPRRERQMISLARQQIEAQNAAGHKISKSNIVGAQIIAAEIAQQTQALDRTMNQVGDRISGSISIAADQLSDAIDYLGDRLCLELSEIKWQLAQQNKTLEGILEVLYKSRNNEARQLVQQGVRHYVNDEFEEAEERFNLALSFDTTDYQLLMNLAYIEIHKENTSGAFTFFKKAISLPESLDAISKARTLWATARLFYAQKDFFKACYYAEQALKYDNQNYPRELYTIGVYTALAGNVRSALDYIERAISLDNLFFSKAAVDPELLIIKTEIIELLGRLSNDASTSALTSLHKVENITAQFKIPPELKISNNHIISFSEHLGKVKSYLKNPSYSECLQCIQSLNDLKKTIPEIKQIYSLEIKLAQLRNPLKSSEDNYNTLIRNGEPKDVRISFPTIATLLVYLLAGLFASLKAIGSINIFIILLWPIPFIGGFFVNEQHEFYGIPIACGIGMLIGAIIANILWIVLKHIEGRKAKIVSQISDARKQVFDLKDKSHNLQKKMNDISIEINQQLAKIKY